MKTLLRDHLRFHFNYVFSQTNLVYKKNIKNKIVPI